MKIAILLTQYLYQHKQLQLPGIGIFTVDTAAPPQEADNKTSHDLIHHIRFTQKQVTVPDPGLIEFMRVKTGKIKALAEADLESYLGDGKTLLNIGKPFHIEGIGHLYKTRQGQYEFRPGEAVTEKIDSASSHHTTGQPGEKPLPKRKSVFEEDLKRISSNRILAVGLMAVTALIIIIWGGYSLYNSHEQGNAQLTQNAAGKVDSAAMLMPDGSAGENTSGERPAATMANKPKENRPSAPSSVAVPPGSYKFVIETTHSKRRALYRYNLLKSYMLDIRMDTKDSSFFKLYFAFPAVAADTNHIKDSLQRMYASREVLIER